MNFTGPDRIAIIMLLACLLFLPATAHVSAAEALDDWTTTSQRTEIAPRFRVDRAITFSEDGKALAIAGRGERNADGGWQRTVPIEGGRTYRFSARFLCENVELPRRSVLVRVTWDGDVPREQRFEYPPTVAPCKPAAAEQAPRWGEIAAVYRAPEQATAARIELIYRWDADGKVYWDEVRFEEAAMPSRPVRLATIFCRPRGGKGPEDNLKTFGDLILKAAEQKPDFICLPEGITVVGTGRSYVEVAEPIPGPSTERLGEYAKKADSWIVAGLYERVGATVYNTAVLIAPDGRYVGKYRKVALPDEEISGGITPGDSFPTFDTPFGRVGMMICWDVFFPEPARALARSGAEIVFLPIWGGNQTLIEARAIENQVYLVTSSYDAKTAIYDRTGKPLAEANEANPIAVVEVDLAEPTRWPWLGDFGGRIPREAPPVVPELP